MLGSGHTLEYADSHATIEKILPKRSWKTITVRDDDWCSIHLLIL